MRGNLTVPQESKPYSQKLEAQCTRVKDTEVHAAFLTYQDTNYHLMGHQEPAKRSRNKCKDK